MTVSRLKRILSAITAASVILSACACARSEPGDTTETSASVTDTTRKPLPTSAPTDTPPPLPTPSPTPLPTEPTMPDLGPLNILNVDGTNDPIEPVAQKDPNIENILLLGIDGGDGADIGHRSDCMCVLSINTQTGTIRLCSIMRDIKAYFPAKDKWAKLNAAYEYGGPGQVVNVINYNFHLDIQKYLVLNFDSFRAAVDALGGVDIEMTQKEARTIYSDSSAQAGVYHLDGTGALVFCRIRKLDSDFNRVARQRRFLITVFKKLQSQDLVTQYTACHNILNLVRTNMSVDELTGHLFEFAKTADQNVAEYTVPASDMYKSTSSGTYYILPDWDRQVPAVQEFLYGA